MTRQTNPTEKHIDAGVRAALTPGGVLRASINVGNPILANLDAAGPVSYTHLTLPTKA